MTAFLSIIIFIIYGSGLKTKIIKKQSIENKIAVNIIRFPQNSIFDLPSCKKNPALWSPIIFPILQHDPYIPVTIPL